MTSTAFAGSWQSLPIPLTDWILDVIASMGHTQMTPVQASTIPLFMGSKDVVVEAVTGSGKTLAFMIPVLERLIRRKDRLRKNEIGALVISPTRELATQIHSIFSLFLSSQPHADDSDNEDNNSERYPDPLLLISSDKSSPARDIENFLQTGADIVIGTPGRVEEFLLGKGRNTVNVKELEVLVLDEADRLLDLGFQQTLTRIITHLPKQRRTGLFSATMTDADALSELVRVGLRNPARVVVKVQAKRTVRDSSGAVTQKREVIDERRIPANLKNLYLTCSPSEKLLQLTSIISHETQTNAAAQFIVYFSTCACVDYFYRILPTLLPKSVSLHSLHGHLQPSARTRALNSFASSSATPSSPAILLATDVAARGLDLPSVDVVIQFDMPSDPKAFSHRAGRTARAGKSGTAWALICEGPEEGYVDFLAVRKIPLKPHPALFEDTEEGSKVHEALQNIRTVLLKDRAMHDLAVKAYVSFVRAYSKHEASYIFRVKDLDLVGVAKCFGLLRLPRMPELKDLDRAGWTDVDVDWDSYGYADKAQESKRLADLSTKQQSKVQDLEAKKRKREEQKMKNEAWSNKVVKKAEKDRKKEIKAKKRKWEKAQAVSTAAPTKEKDDEMEDEDEGDDWEELAREERMAKKVKKGEISQKTFDAEFGELD